MMSLNKSRAFVLMLLVAACVLTASSGCPPPGPQGELTIANLAGLNFARSAPAAGAVLAENSEQLLKAAIAELNDAKDLDFVILTGNILSRSRPADLDRLKEILDGLEAPYFVVLGSQDGTSAPDADDQRAVSRSTIIWTFQGHGFSGPKGYWAQEVTPGTVLVGLDTARVGRRGGFLDDKQLKWLDETLNTYREKAVIIIAHHGLTNFHPFDESVVWQHLTVRNSAAVRDVISRHPNVILAITGHHHFAAGKAIGHVVHIASPSLTVWPLAYHLIRINKKSVETLWLPIGSDKLQAKARGRLFADHEWRGPFPAGEQGDTELIRLFGAHKSQTFKFAEIRP